MKPQNVLPDAMRTAVGPPAQWWFNALDQRRIGVRSKNCLVHVTGIHADGSDPWIQIVPVGHPTRSIVLHTTIDEAVLEAAWSETPTDRSVIHLTQAGKRWSEVGARRPLGASALAAQRRLGASRSVTARPVWRGRSARGALGCPQQIGRACVASAVASASSAACTASRRVARRALAAPAFRVRARHAPGRSARGPSTRPSTASRNGTADRRRVQAPDHREGLRAPLPKTVKHP